MNGDYPATGGGGYFLGGIFMRGYMPIPVFLAHDASKEEKY